MRAGWAIVLAAASLCLGTGAAPGSTEAERLRLPLEQRVWEDRGITEVVPSGSVALFAAGVTNSGRSPSFTYSNVVDVYDAATGRWSAGALSVARQWPVPAAVGTQVLLAGGWQSGPSRQWDHLFDTVDLFDTATGRWSTATLSEARYRMRAVTVGPYVLFAGGEFSCNSCGTTRYVAAVDIYDSAMGRWSAATLSQGGDMLRAIPLGPLVLFAGG